MPSIAGALSRPWLGLTTLARDASLMARRIALALEVRAERRRLLGLDEGALKDMGFNKGQAHCEASRGFWDVPVDRLRI
jgi:uncharacterized protein YjiS (DUF1127 family)